jgi:hypothetical protein
MFCYLLQRYYSSLNCSVKANAEENCVTLLEKIQLSSQLYFIPLPTALFEGEICVFRAQNNKVMICTYWWFLSITAEREVGQDKRLETDRSVQCAVSRKTEIFKHPSLRKTCMASLWWRWRTLGQGQVRKSAFCTGFQWRYVNCSAGNLRLPRKLGCSNAH